jgi:hAT family C-terminal dimerisation region
VLAKFRTCTAAMSFQYSTVHLFWHWFSTVQGSLHRTAVYCTDLGAQIGRGSPGNSWSVPRYRCRYFSQRVANSAVTRRQPLYVVGNSVSPQLTQTAFYILSVPAMSSETERIFSGAKLTISPRRLRVGEDIIEATECLNRWYKAGL